MRPLATPKSLLPRPPALVGVSGQASVIDGDTIEIRGQKIRLHGAGARRPQTRTAQPGSKKAAQWTAAHESSIGAHRHATPARQGIVAGCVGAGGFRVREGTGGPIGLMLGGSLAAPSLAVSRPLGSRWVLSDCCWRCASSPVTRTARLDSRSCRETKQFNYSMWSRAEPRRDCRRHFGLSHAAMAGSSSIA